jgi:hypothetical protein
MIPLLLASAVLFVAVALMVIRPLLAPREESVTPAGRDEARPTEPASGPEADAPAAGVDGPPVVDATDRDVVEALIASRRARMERHATGAGT